MTDPDFDLIPEELRLLPQWVCWRLVQKPGADKPTKPLYRAVDPSREAKTNDPSTWAPYSVALAALGKSSNRLNGIGFVFTASDPYAGVDFDDCIDADGTIDEIVLKRIRSLASYSEVSPSGRGVKVVVKAIHPGGGKKKKGIEMYDRVRYFTLTGRHLEGSPLTVNERNAEFQALHAQVWPPAAAPSPSGPKREPIPVDLSDADLLKVAFSAKNGAAVRALWGGNTSAHPSPSEAVLALTSHLAFYCGPDPGRIDRMFRQSGLFSDKWTEKWERLGTQTIETALSGKVEFYSPPSTARMKFGRGFVNAGGTTSNGTGKSSGTDDAPDDVTSSGPQQDDANPPLYEVTPSGTVWHKRANDDVVLANFSAQITQEERLDDGAEVQTRFNLEACLNGHTFHLSLTATQFVAMNWPIEKLGGRARITPGTTCKDRLRDAIQTLSVDLQTRHSYSHTGWRLIGQGDEAEWVHLTGSGGIGVNGLRSDIAVALDGGLSRFLLPEPPTGAAAHDAIRSVFRLIEVADEAITVPLLAAVFRSVISTSDLSLFLSGPTGARKSELAALAQRFFGADFDARTLPANWSSTVNALEAQAFLAKDVLLVIDEFCPKGSPNDVLQLHAKADRVLRGQANGSGRGRLRADGTLRPERYPRGTILATGEDIPRGESLRGRILILEVGPSAVNLPRLTAAQRAGGAGAYASVMAGFLQWLACQYEVVRTRWRDERDRLRDDLLQQYPDAHPRTPGIVADLALAWKYFLTYAVSVRALTTTEASAMMERGRSALFRAGDAQSEHQSTAEPAVRFLSLLRSALDSGRAHLTGLDGRQPAGPALWGWKEEMFGSGEYERKEWRPKGNRIGWTDEVNVYLDPDPAYFAAQQLAQGTGDALTVSPQTLAKRLQQKGYLASVEHDGNRTRREVKKTLEGGRKRVLHILAVSLLGKAGHVGPVGQSDKSCPFPGVDEDATAPPFRPTFRDEREKVGRESGAREEFSGVKSTSNGSNAPSAPHAPLATEDMSQDFQRIDNIFMGANDNEVAATNGGGWGEP